MYYLPYKKADGSWSRERGHVKFYNKAKIGYTIGNSSVKYIYPKSASFKITFKNFYPLDEHSYRTKKGLVLSYKPEVKQNVWKERFSKIYNIIMENKWSNQREMSRLSGYSRDSLRKWTVTPADNTILTPVKGLNDDTFLDIRRDDGKTIQIPAKMS